jgi:hypothetical protein
MMKDLLQVKESMSMPEMRIALGNALGLGEPVPMPVLLRAINDPDFARDLMTCRGSPAFLAALFDDRRTLAYAAPAAEAPISGVALASKAAAALVRWGKAGFSTVDADVLARREEACLVCPHLGEPQSMLQKLVPAATVSERVGSRLGRKICTLCGCVAAKKIRLPTESCPGNHPTRTGQTRWNEPIPAASDA